MKAIGFVLLSVAVYFVTGCGSLSTRQNTAQNGRPPRLQVAVNVPPSMSILRDEEIAEAFAYRVSAILHEEGFRGRINVVDGDPLIADVPVLAIDLREWRVDRIGNVDCTFTARLERAGESQNLGLFSGTALMMWSRRDWFARAEGFEESAADAIRNLASRLEKTGMMDRRVTR